ncbi:MAG: bis(5'-nucleosyl)-tetraphosphatase (symmetrical) YqeK [Elusimicrobia bacterium]|nr:bis(5'-nucleosyl)-tetraphosphatase (symmetrical) YqeK [Candidatus Obscuribacterium magneticum]
MLSSKAALKLLKSNLSRERVRHSLAVAKVAQGLAKKYGWNPELAYQAGLLHDWAKEWSDKRLINHVRRFRLRVPDFSFILKVSPALLHSYVSADVIKRKGWVRDPSALKAIASHTLGHPRMSVADRILYVADLIAFDRTFKEVKIVRRLAERSLHRAFVAALVIKLSCTVRKGKPLHPLSLTVWRANAKEKQRDMSLRTQPIVIPAKAGIHSGVHVLDSRFRGNDVKSFARRGGPAMIY